PEHTSLGLLPTQPRGCAGGQRRRAACEQGCGQEYRERSTHGAASLNVKNSPVMPVATTQHRRTVSLQSRMGRACRVAKSSPAATQAGQGGGLAGSPGIHTIWVARSLLIGV